MPKLHKLYDILPKHIRVIDRYSIYMPHNIYTKQNLKEYHDRHRIPTTFSDKLAYFIINAIRKTYDTFTGYNIDKMTQAKWLIRCLFLETVAGVPGMVGGMGTHLKTIRDLKNDKGRIHHLLEEAENQRFHLHIFLQLRKPGRLFRIFILLAQSLFFGFYMLSFLTVKRFSYRFVGYLQEEACHTYSNMLRHIDTPGLSLNNYTSREAPQSARLYWSLPDDATLRDVIQVIRADEATHREVNHFFADIPDEDVPEYYKLDIQEQVQKQIYGHQLHESKIPSEYKDWGYAKSDFPYDKK